MTVLPTPLVFVTSREHLFRLFSHLLLFGLVLLADGWLLVRAARIMGVYLALALEAGTAAVGAIVIGSTIHSTLRKTRNGALRGVFVPYDYARLTATVIAAAFLLLPGFAGDALGLLIYLPPGRQIVAWIILRRRRRELEESYEYHKIATFSGSAGWTTQPDQEKNGKQ